MIIEYSNLLARFVARPNIDITYQEIIIFIVFIIDFFSVIIGLDTHHFTITIMSMQRYNTNTSENTQRIDTFCNESKNCLCFRKMQNITNQKMARKMENEKNSLANASRRIFIFFFREVITPKNTVLCMNVCAGISLF